MEPSNPHVRFVSRSPGGAPKLRSRHPKKTAPKNWLAHLIRLCVLPFWGGIWISIFLVGMVATGSLINPNTSSNVSSNVNPNASPNASPNSSNGQSAAAIAPSSAIATHPESSRGSVPVWLFGAIAVTCTAGSILISKRLYPKGSSRQTIARSRKRVCYPVSRATPTSSRPSQALHPFVPTAAPLRLPKAVVWKKSTLLDEPIEMEGRGKERSPSFSIAAKPFQARSASPQVPRSQAPRSQAAPSIPVTVVPSEELHPLDLQEGGGMDTTELQRQRSLQFWFDTPTSEE